MIAYPRRFGFCLHSGLSDAAAVPRPPSSLGLRLNAEEKRKTKLQAVLTNYFQHEFLSELLEQHRPAAVPAPSSGVVGLAEVIGGGGGQRRRRG